MSRNGRTAFGRGRVGEAVLTALSAFPFAKVASSREPIVLLYHGVPKVATSGEVDAQVFERHIRFLTDRFEVVGLTAERPRRALEKQRVILTFDDGFRNNAEVAAPILRRYKAPATFFVCTRHTTGADFLWVSYIDALARFYRWPELRFREERFDMRPSRRVRSVERIRTILREQRPHPAATYKVIAEELPQLSDFVSSKQYADRYAGLSADQVGELAADPLFAIGAHTSDHPFLSTCEPDEMRRQIAGNLRWIEGATGKPCRVIAYPSGDYDARVLTACEAMGIELGYAVTPKIGTKPALEIPRIGVYAPSEAVLGFKVQWGRHMRAARIAVG